MDLRKAFINPGSYVWLANYSGAKELDYNHRELQLVFVIDFEGEPLVRHTLSAHAEQAVVQVHPVKHLAAQWPPEVAVDDRRVEEFLLLLAPQRTAT